jgi:hypothetical protein
VLLTSVNTVLYKTHYVLNYSIVYKVKQGDRRSKATKLVIKRLIVSLVEGAAYTLSLIEQRVSIIK